MSRETAEHSVPVETESGERTASAAAALTSAVLSTIMASLPPISRNARFSHLWLPQRLLADRSAIRSPTSLGTREVDELRHRVIDEIVANETTWNWEHS